MQHILQMHKKAAAPCGTAANVSDSGHQQWLTASITRFTTFCTTYSL